MHAKSILMAGLGSAIAIAVLWGLAALTGYPWLMAPFGATAVLLFAAPSAVLSQPINVVAGHVVAAVIGVACVALAPGHGWLAAVVVGLAISVTAALRIIHPPAGASALLAYMSGASWWFVLMPALASSVLLVVLAWAWQNLQGGTYPLSARE
jgi:CBS-domain-containing membrane protein